MTKFALLLSTVCLAAGLASAAEPPAPTVAKLFDSQLAGVEKEVVSLAEAMPEEQYNFAPTQGAFEGVRTFAQQAKHIAITNYEMASVVLGEKMTLEVGPQENGPEAIRTKAEIVKFLKDSYAYCHKAEKSLTKDNLTDMVDGGDGHKVPRGLYANLAIWHSYDHYGQMVEYARMNHVIPPASRK